MVKMVLDATMAAKLAGVGAPVEFCDASGQTIGFFNPLLSIEEALRQCPYSDEEIEQQRQQRTGRPLSDILRDLERQ